jgi:hypothetical protein
MRLPVGPFPSPDPRKFQPLFLCWPGGILEQNHHADCHKLDFHNVFLVLSFNSTSRLADPPTVRKFIPILRVQTTLGSFRKWSFDQGVSRRRRLAIFGGVLLRQGGAQGVPP